MLADVAMIIPDSQKADFKLKAYTLPNTEFGKATSSSVSCLLIFQRQLAGPRVSDATLRGGVRYPERMSDVTRLLEKIEDGDPRAGEVAQVETLICPAHAALGEKPLWTDLVD